MSKNSPSEYSPSSKEKSQSEFNSLLKQDNYNIQYGGVSSADDEPLIKDEPQKQNTCMKLYRVFVTLTIEPIVFCFVFAFVMNMSILSNMMMDKGCLNYFNYSSEVCKNLSGHPDEKKNVEVLATDFSLYSNLMSLVGAFFMIFIAPWSDKYGRKPPLLFAVFGVILTDVGLMLCTIHFESRLEYLILAKVPSEIFGGFICVLTTIYSHASEVSSEKNRTLKYTTVEISMGLGMALGSLTGGLLYRYYGYFYVYVTAGSLHVFCFVWVLFVLEETTGLDVDLKLIEKIKDFFVCKSFKKSIQATFRGRDGNNRALLLLLILSMCVIVLTYESFSSIGYVYVHHIYNWDPTTYSMVNTTFMLIMMSATIICVPILIRFCKIRDFSLGMIGAFSMMMKNFILAFAVYHEYIFYLGQLSGFFGPLSSLVVRTGVSKLVEKDELGRVFSFLATCEAVLPMMGTIAITKIFEATIDIKPNVTYGMSAVLLFLPLATFIWAFRSSRNAYNSLSVSANDHVREKA